jgi:hypothetical protein
VIPAVKITAETHPGFSPPGQPPTTETHLTIAVDGQQYTGVFPKAPSPHLIAFLESTLIRILGGTDEEAQAPYDNRPVAWGGKAGA